MNSTILTDDQKFALKALLEETPVLTVGAFVGETDNGDNAVTYAFAATMPGYPGWNWTITIAHLPGAEPTVVESELTPAEGALLAPDWVPWSDRMDDYRAAQAAMAEAGAADDDEDLSDDELDDDIEDDDDDDDDLGSALLHGGDLDGVDIDELDDAELDDGQLDDAQLDDGQPVEVEELELLPVQVAEREDAEPESDSGSENPPRVARRRKRASKEQQNNQAD
ncbi:MAG: hypothetical protein QOI14_69 [Actinomycetota bacterium]|nr:hypothetical protein [Actinomycetota bacterium]